MKKLTQLLTLSLMAMMLAIPALAQDTTASPAASPAAAPAQDNAEAKAALYEKVRTNIKTNQPLAYEAAKEYLQKYPTDDDDIAKYLKSFVTKYEAGSQKADFNKMLVDKKWAEAFTLGKQISARQPEDLATSINTSWAGLQLALSGNNSQNTDALNATMKSIQMIESGKTLEEGKPYTDKNEHLGWLNYALGLYNLRNNRSNESANYFIKAATFEGSTKANPGTYIQLAEIYEKEYGRLQENYDKTFKDKPETEESKAATLQIKNFLEPMIDAYARAVAYSGTEAKFATIKTAAKQRLEELYKFSKGSTDGLDALIASVKTKPLPPQPNADAAAPVTAPATTSTPTTAPSDANKGTNSPTTTGATTTPATGSGSTAKPANSAQTGPMDKKPATPAPSGNGSTPKRK